MRLDGRCKEIMIMMQVFNTVDLVFVSLQVNVVVSLFTPAFW